MGDPNLTAGSEARVTSATPPTRPFYWSVRRELWENRSLYIAPLIVAAIEVIGFIISAIGLPGRRRGVLLLDPVTQRHAIEQPYDVAAIMMMFTVFVVGIFYCLDALHGERRERSILFWKSLPVSDLTTVLSKISIPMLVLPLITFVLSVCVHLLILCTTSVLLIGSGMSPASTWNNVPFLQNWFVLFYGLIVITLWHAPIYGWFVLVSAWVRRATFLWAVLPFMGAVMFERITFGTGYVGAFLKHRLFSFAQDAFDFGGRQHPTVNSLAQLTPGRYVTSPGLWLGLTVAALLVVAAARLRRYRGPI